MEDRRGKRKKDQAPRTELERQQIEDEQLKHKLYLVEMERDLPKKLDEIEGRDAYHKWASGKMSRRTAQNEEIAKKVEQIHMEYPDKGYRRLNDDLRHDYNIYVNDKRILRICRTKNIKSTIKYSSHGCTRKAKNPQYLAENLLNREFHADKPNEKRLTDVTEFKWYEGIEVHKIYLNAILDLYDQRTQVIMTLSSFIHPRMMEPPCRPVYMYRENESQASER